LDTSNPLGHSYNLGVFGEGNVTGWKSAQDRETEGPRRAFSDSLKGRKLEPWHEQKRGGGDDSERMEGKKVTKIEGGGSGEKPGKSSPPLGTERGQSFGTWGALSGTEEGPAGGRGDWACFRLERVATGRRGKQ